MPVKFPKGPVTNPAKSNGHHSAPNDLDAATGTRSGAVYDTMRAALALHGHGLYRSDPNDGPVTYLVVHDGQVRRLPSIEAVCELLASLGTRQ